VSSENKQVVVVLVIMAVMLVGLLGWIVFYKSSTDDSFFTYNGFDFRKTAQGFQIQIFINEGQTANTLIVRSDPRDLESFPLDPAVLSLKDKEAVYATIDPYANLTGVTTLAVLELDSVLDNPFLYGIQVNATFTQPYDVAGLDVKTCEDATEDVAVLWFRLEDEVGVYEEEGCFIVAGVVEDDFISGVDRILYTLLGIMDV
jgi:hypothetical protein